jgi:hypothetical protein
MARRTRGASTRECASGAGVFESSQKPPRRIFRGVFSFGVAEILFEALLLGFLVRRCAPHNATADLFNMVLVVGGALLGGLLIEWQLAQTIGWWTLALHAVLVAALLIKFSGTNPVQALTITAIFFALKIGVQLGLAALRGDL